MCCLPMTKRPSCPLRSIVCRLPPRVSQELAQLLEAPRCHSDLHPTQGRYLRISLLALPSLEALLRLLQRAALTAACPPDAMPLLHKLARDLKWSAGWTRQELSQLLLLLRTEMLRPT